MCLDGSAPAYHFDKGFGSGVNNWIVHMEVIRVLISSTENRKYREDWNKFAGWNGINITICCQFVDAYIYLSIEYIS